MTQKRDRSNTRQSHDWTTVRPYEIEGESLVSVLAAGGFLGLADAISETEYRLLLSGHATDTAERIVALQPIAEDAHRACDQAMFEHGWDSPPHDAARSAANLIEQALAELRRRGAAL